VEHSFKKTDWGVKNLFSAHLTRSIGFIFREEGVVIQ
jgi:hypothetical protein